MKIGQPADKPAPADLATARADANSTARTGPAKAVTTGAAAMPAGAAAKARQPNEVEASAKVEISRAAANLISSQRSANADFDAEKVARISQAINDNTYQVNAAAIADKLIANAQELLGKVPQ